MASGFSGDLFYGGNGSVNGRPSILSGFRQQQQQQQQGLFDQQIAQRKAEFVTGKRSLSDFQQHQILLHHQQQQQHPFLVLQKPQTQHQMSLLQQQILLRSVKQRNNTLSSSPISPLSVDLCSPNSISNNNNINNININNNNNSLSSSSTTTRFGAPIYPHQNPHLFQQQQRISVVNNNNHQLLQNNQFNPNNNCLIPNNNLINPVQDSHPGISSLGYSNFKQGSQPENFSGAVYSNLVSNNPVVASKVEPNVEAHKFRNTLYELEKQLLCDDNEEENDTVSVVTNSEWSETFQTLMGSNGNLNPSPNTNPTPSPIATNHACSSTSGNSNTNIISNNNNIISPSPTSSTSSCCSTSAPVPATQQAPAETLTVKQIISEAATAISEGKNELAAEFLTRLARVSNVQGNSEQRLGYHMGNALCSRAFPDEISPPVRELYSDDQTQAMYSLYEISPCFKFGLLAANLVMLEAITGAQQEGLKVHVVDFDVGHGGQYMNLLRAMHDRRAMLGIKETGSNEMKITIVETGMENRGVDESMKELLIKVAENYGISLKFERLTLKITELTRESLGCEDGEAIVVNFAFMLYRVPDESVSIENLRDALLRRVKDLSPRAVTLVEQEMNGNTAPFMTRVNESCAYFGALFESLESTLAVDHSDRVRIEERLGKKMANLVACEGRERVERAELFGKWRARMGMAGFELKHLNPNVAESIRAKLESAQSGNPGFTVKEENGGVAYGWKDRTLVFASAWR
ncbi:unnamed protein product [Amaranthus hypochondriacus]